MQRVLSWAAIVVKAGLKKLSKHIFVYATDNMIFF